MEQKNLCKSVFSKGERGLRERYTEKWAKIINDRLKNKSGKALER